MVVPGDCKNHQNFIMHNARLNLSPACAHQISVYAGPLHMYTMFFNPYDSGEEKKEQEAFLACHQQDNCLHIAMHFCVHALLCACTQKTNKVVICES